MMLTQSTSANRHDHRHDATDTTMPHGSQPGSPTLTNPDMILPDYNDLLGYNDLPQPQRPTWNRGHSIQDGFQFHDNSFYVNPDPLSTPIIYGNGTMLSDIGEVTEAESNAGTMASRNASRRIAHSFDDDSRLPKNLVRNKPRYTRRDRRFSNESTSTIGTLDRTPFPDFDDTMSVGGDSIFQGDDEESLASSYAEEIAVPRPLHNAKKVSIKKPSDEGSANFISKRAEEILANAKQRLTDMEDNLSRARTLSYSTVTNTSMNASSFGRSASISHRTSPAHSTVSSAHGRNMSGNGTANSSTGELSLQRSASALGSAGGYRRILPTSRSVDVLRSATDHGAYTVTYQGHDMPLEPLGEDEYADTISGRMGSSGNSSYGVYFDTGSARSSIDVRDLQDQMNGLKGKISTLREQARVDSLKRRSLQSLRTPSPFTYASWDPVHTDSHNSHASENDLGLPEATDTDTHGDVDPRVVENEEEKEEIQRPREDFEVVHAKEVAASHNQTSHQKFSSSMIHHSVPDQGISKLYDENKNSTREDDSHRRSNAAAAAESGNDKTTDDAAPQGYESESGESLYHDSYQHQISHEDREDAFDYEHFFLHSAMGSMRSRSGSVDSNDSVETTRGPTALRRRSSVDTTASAESFQTATEELNNHSPTTTAQGYRVYTPADLFEVGRPASGVSFHDSSSGSDSTAPYSQDRRRQGSVSYRPSSIISVSTRPSCSSFKSTGTNRSFPLVSKTKRHSGILTPGSSPDQGVKKHPSKTMLKESPSIGEADIGSRGPSPAIQMLSPSDQSTVEALVAGLGQCVLVLGEAGGAATGAHEIYRRRIEAARKILEGKMEVP